MSLAAESQILIRNIDELECQNLLLINPPNDYFLTEFEEKFDKSSSSIFTTNFATSTFFEQKGNCTFDWKFEPEQKFDTIVLYYPKAKQEALDLLKSSLNYIQANGDIFIVGENRSGIKSIAKLADSIGLHAAKIDSAKHCSLFQISLDDTDSITPFAYKEDTFSFEVAKQSVKISSIAGVFNHGELDVGTRLLLENLPSDLKVKKMLDFGCGCGVIGTFMGLTYQPKHIDMVDVSALAVESATRTSEANGVDANVFASDGLSKVSGKYDLIISNPPFHSGIKTQYDTTEGFLKQASRYLQPYGKLIIVANSFLKYQPILEAHYADVTVLFKNNKFAIYQAVMLPNRKR